MDLHRLRVVEFDTSVREKEGEKKYIAQHEEYKQEDWKTSTDGNKDETRDENQCLDDNTTPPGMTKKCHDKISAPGTSKKYLDDTSSPTDTSQKCPVDKLCLPGTSEKYLDGTTSTSPPETSKNNNFARSKSKSEIFKIPPKIKPRKRDFKINSSDIGLTKQFEDSAYPHQKNRTFNLRNRNSRVNHKDENVKENKEKNEEVHFLFTRETPSFIKYCKKPAKNERTTKKKKRDSELPNDFYGFQKSNRSVDQYQYRISCFNFLNTDKMCFKKLRRCKPSQSALAKNCGCKHHGMKVLDTAIEKDPSSSIYYNLSTNPRKSERIYEYQEQVFGRESPLSMTKDAIVAVSSASLSPLSISRRDAITGPSKVELSAVISRRPQSVREKPPALDNVTQEPRPLPSTPKPGAAPAQSKLKQKHNKMKKEKFISSVPLGFISKFAKQIIDIHTKRKLGQRSCIEYIGLGLLIVVWSPCLLAIILAWVVTFPMKLTSKTPKTERCRKSKRCRRKDARCEYQRMCFENYLPKTKTSFLTSATSWYTRTVGTFINTFTSFLKLKKKAPTCAGSSFLPLSHPNPRKRYTLFYADNRGWVMKPLRCRNSRSSATTRLVESMRCELRPKLRCLKNLPKKLKKVRPCPVHGDGCYPRHNSSAAGDACSEKYKSPWPSCVCWDKFSKDSSKSRRLGSRHHRRQQVNIPPTFSYPTSGIEFNSADETVNAKQFNSNDIADNIAHEDLAIYHLGQLKNGTLPFGVVFNHPRGKKHPLITNLETFRAHKFGLAGKTLNMSTKCTPRLVIKGLQGQLPKCWTKHEAGKAVKKTPGLQRITSFTGVTTSIPKHISSYRQNRKHEEALNSYGRNQKSVIKNKNINSLQKNLNFRNKCVLADIPQSAGTKQANTNTYKINCAHKTQNTSKHILYHKVTNKPKKAKPDIASKCAKHTQPTQAYKYNTDKTCVPTQKHSSPAKIKSSMKPDTVLNYSFRKKHKQSRQGYKYNPDQIPVATQKQSNTADITTSTNVDIALNCPYGEKHVQSTQANKYKPHQVPVATQKQSNKADITTSTNLNKGLNYPYGEKHRQANKYKPHQVPVAIQKQSNKVEITTSTNVDIALNCPCGEKHEQSKYGYKYQPHQIPVAIQMQSKTAENTTMTNRDKALKRPNKEKYEQYKHGYKYKPHQIPNATQMRSTTADNTTMTNRDIALNCSCEEKHEQYKHFFKNKPHQSPVAIQMQSRTADNTTMTNRDIAFNCPYEEKYKHGYKYEPHQIPNATQMQSRTADNTTITNRDIALSYPCGKIHEQSKQAYKYQPYIALNYLGVMKPSTANKDILFIPSTADKNTICTQKIRSPEYISKKQDISIQKQASKIETSVYCASDYGRRKTKELVRLEQTVFPKQACKDKPYKSTVPIQKQRSTEDIMTSSNRDAALNCFRTVKPSTANKDILCIPSTADKDTICTQKIISPEYVSKKQDISIQKQASKIETSVYCGSDYERSKTKECEPYKSTFPIQKQRSTADFMTSTNRDITLNYLSAVMPSTANKEILCIPSTADKETICTQKIRSPEYVSKKQDISIQKQAPKIETSVYCGSDYERIKTKERVCPEQTVLPKQANKYRPYKSTVQKQGSTADIMTSTNRDVALNYLGAVKPSTANKEILCIPSTGDKDTICTQKTSSSEYVPKKQDISIEKQASKIETSVYCASDFERSKTKELVRSEQTVFPKKTIDCTSCCASTSCEETGSLKQTSSLKKVTDWSWGGELGGSRKLNGPCLYKDTQTIASLISQENKGEVETERLKRAFSKKMVDCGCGVKPKQIATATEFASERQADENTFKQYPPKQQTLAIDCGLDTEQNLNTFLKESFPTSRTFLANRTENKPTKQPLSQKPSLAGRTLQIRRVLNTEPLSTRQLQTDELLKQFQPHANSPLFGMSSDWRCDFAPQIAQVASVQVSSSLFKISPDCRCGVTPQQNKPDKQMEHIANDSKNTYIHETGSAKEPPRQQPRLTRAPSHTLQEQPKSFRIASDSSSGTYQPIAAEKRLYNKVTDSQSHEAKDTQSKSLAIHPSTNGDKLTPHSYQNDFIHKAISKIIMKETDTPALKKSSITKFPKLSEPSPPHLLTSSSKQPDKDSRKTSVRTEAQAEYQQNLSIQQPNLSEQSRQYRSQTTPFSDRQGLTSDPVPAHPRKTRIVTETPPTTSTVIQELPCDCTCECNSESHLKSKFQQHLPSAQTDIPKIHSLHRSSLSKQSSLRIRKIKLGSNVTETPPTISTDIRKLPCDCTCECNSVSRLKSKFQQHLPSAQPDIPKIDSLHRSSQSKQFKSPEHLASKNSQPTSTLFGIASDCPSGVTSQTFQVSNSKTSKISLGTDGQPKFSQHLASVPPDNSKIDKTLSKTLKSLEHLPSKMSQATSPVFGIASDCRCGDTPQQPDKQTKQIETDSKKTNTHNNSSSAKASPSQQSKLTQNPSHSLQEQPKLFVIASDCSCGSVTGSKSHTARETQTKSSPGLKKSSISPPLESLQDPLHEQPYGTKVGTTSSKRNVVKIDNTRSKFSKSTEPLASQISQAKSTLFGIASDCSCGVTSQIGQFSNPPASKTLLGTDGKPEFSQHLSSVQPDIPKVDRTFLKFPKSLEHLPSIMSQATSPVFGIASDCRCGDTPPQNEPDKQTKQIETDSKKTNTHKSSSAKAPPSQQSTLTKAPSHTLQEQPKLFGIASDCSCGMVTGSKSHTAKETRQETRSKFSKTPDHSPVPKSLPRYQVESLQEPRGDQPYYTKRSTTSPKRNIVDNTRSKFPKSLEHSPPPKSLPHKCLCPVETLQDPVSEQPFGTKVSTTSSERFIVQVDTTRSKFKKSPDHSPPPKSLPHQCRCRVETLLPKFLPHNCPCPVDTLQDPVGEQPYGTKVSTTSSKRKSVKVDKTRSKFPKSPDHSPPPKSLSHQCGCQIESLQDLVGEQLYGTKVSTTSSKRNIVKVDTTRSKFPKSPDHSPPPKSLPHQCGCSIESLQDSVGEQPFGTKVSTTSSKRNIVKVDTTRSKFPKSPDHSPPSKSLPHQCGCPIESLQDPVGEQPFGTKVSTTSSKRNIVKVDTIRSKFPKSPDHSPPPKSLSHQCECPIESLQDPVGEQPYGTKVSTTSSKRKSVKVDKTRSKFPKSPDHSPPPKSLSHQCGCQIESLQDLVGEQPYGTKVSTTSSKRNIVKVDTTRSKFPKSPNHSPPPKSLSHQCGCPIESLQDPVGEQPYGTKVSTTSSKRKSVKVDKTRSKFPKSPDHSPPPKSMSHQCGCPIESLQDPVGEQPYGTKVSTTSSKRKSVKVDKTRSKFSQPAEHSPPQKNLLHNCACSNESLQNSVGKKSFQRFWKSVGSRKSKRKTLDFPYKCVCSSSHNNIDKSGFQTDISVLRMTSRQFSIRSCERTEGTRPVNEPSSRVQYRSTISRLVMSLRSKLFSRKISKQTKIPENPTERPQSVTFTSSQVNKKKVDKTHTRLVRHGQQPKMSQSSTFSPFLCTSCHLRHCPNDDTEKISLHTCKSMLDDESNRSLFRRSHIMSKTSQNPSLAVHSSHNSRSCVNHQSFSKQCTKKTRRHIRKPLVVETSYSCLSKSKTSQRPSFLSHSSRLESCCHADNTSSLRPSSCYSYPRLSQRITSQQSKTSEHSSIVMSQTPTECMSDETFSTPKDGMSHQILKTLFKRNSDSKSQHLPRQRNRSQFSAYFNRSQETISEKQSILTQCLSLSHTILPGMCRCAAKHLGKTTSRQSNSRLQQFPNHQHFNRSQKRTSAQKQSSKKFDPQYSSSLNNYQTTPTARQTVPSQHPLSPVPLKCKSSSLFNRSQSKPLVEKIGSITDKISPNSRKNKQEKTSSTVGAQTALIFPSKCAYWPETLYQLSKKFSQVSRKSVEKISPSETPPHLLSAQPMPPDKTSRKNKREKTSPTLGAQTAPIIQSKCACWPEKLHQLSKKISQHSRKSIDKTTPSKPRPNLLIAKSTQPDKNSHQTRVGTEAQAENPQHLSIRQPKVSKQLRQPEFCQYLSNACAQPNIPKIYSLHRSSQSKQVTEKVVKQFDTIPHIPEAEQVIPILSGKCRCAEEQKVKAERSSNNKIQRVKPIYSPNSYRLRTDNQRFQSPPASHPTRKSTLGTDIQPEFSHHLSNQAHEAPASKLSQPHLSQQTDVPHSAPLHNSQSKRKKSTKYRSSKHGNVQEKRKSLHKIAKAQSPGMSHYSSEKFKKSHLISCVYPVTAKKKRLREHVIIQRSEISQNSGNTQFKPNPQIQVYLQNLQYQNLLSQMPKNLDKLPPGLLHQYSTGLRRTGTAEGGVQQPYPDFNRVSMRYPNHNRKQSELILGQNCQPFTYTPASKASARDPCFTNQANKCAPKTRFDESALRRAYKRRPLRYTPPRQQLPSVVMENKLKENKKKAAAAKKRKAKRSRKQNFFQCLLELIDQTEREAWPNDITCHPMWLNALKHRPCFWIYKMFPRMYPSFLNLYKYQKYFNQICVYILTLCFWSPLFLCGYICCKLIS